jgi:enoyl-CoA hydratase/carnithine racemase
VLGTPILSLAVLDQIEESVAALEAEAWPLVLRSEHPSVFLAGADLHEIADLDPSTCTGYAQRGRRVLRALERHPAPIVAAVHGFCAGGGFDLVLSCDAVIVGPRARFEHPGVRRGLVTGWSGSTRLPSAVGRPGSRSVLLECLGIDARAAVSCGLAASLSADPVRTAASTALRLSRLDPCRIELWRRLRGPRFVDRFRASVVHK